MTLYYNDSVINVQTTDSTPALLHISVASRLYQNALILFCKKLHIKENNQSIKNDPVIALVYEGRVTYWK